MNDEEDEGMWSFGPSPAARTWTFAEREEPAIDFSGQFKHDPIHILDADGEGKPLYYSALMLSTASTT